MLPVSVIAQAGIAYVLAQPREIARVQRPLKERKGGMDAQMNEIRVAQRALRRVGRIENRVSMITDRCGLSVPDVTS